MLFFLVAPASFNADLLTSYRPAVSILLDCIRNFLIPPGVSLLPGSPSAPITIYTTASIFFGFLLASPVILYEVYAFIRPALEYSGLRLPTKIIWASVILFLSGCAFGFLVLMPFVIYGLFAFFPFVGIDAYFINAQDFYSMTFWTVLVSGLSFLTPVVIYLVTKYLGFDPRTITSKRKYLWAGIFVGSAFITPDSNILADLILFIPLIVMVEASLLIAKRTRKKDCKPECCPDGMCLCGDCYGCKELEE